MPPIGSQEVHKSVPRGPRRPRNPRSNPRRRPIGSQEAPRAFPWAHCAPQSSRNTPKRPPRGSQGWAAPDRHGDVLKFYNVLCVSFFVFDTAQGASNIAKATPDCAQEAPMRLPRRPQEAPKRPSVFSWGPKAPQKIFETTPDGDQEALKMPPRAFPGAQGAPKGPEHTPKRPPRGYHG
jgi:hypothetical protein